MRSSSPGGTDYEALQGWLLKFGDEITRLRTSIETFVDWLANGRPPWEAYHKFMSGRMIALDKQPGVRPIGVGETWRHIFPRLYLRSRDQKQPWYVSMTSCVPDSRRELTEQSKGLKFSGTRTCLRRNGVFRS